MGTHDKEPFKNIISVAMDGLGKGDLSGLNAAVEESVNSVLDSVEKKLNEIGDISETGNPINLSTYKYKTNYSTGSATMERQRKLEEEKRKRQAELDKINAKKAEIVKKKKESSVVTMPVPFSPVGNVSSVLTMVTGGIGLAFSGVNLLRCAANFAFGNSGAISLITFSLITAFFGVVLKKGASDKNRLARAKRYAILAGNRQYISIEELATGVNQSSRKTLSDLSKMLKMGYYPEGHIDADKTTLMLSDSVYKEYLRSQAGKPPVDTTSREIKDEEKEISELDQMINEGNEYIKTLHGLNDEIPGEVISAKLARLENLLKQIFACLKKHPEQLPRMHEVMNYYLPTVIKLVEAYKEYDSLTEAGDEIIDAKTQIEESIDTINEALKKLLNNLFRDSVWDVTTDASVLNTMLAQKGLVSGINSTENKE